MGSNSFQPADFLAERVKQVKPSPTLAITQRASEMRKAGKDIIGLGAGEPDFDTPDHIKQAAIKAINNGQTKYTAVDGTIELKQAVQTKFNNFNKLNYDLDEIIVSTGGKQAIYNLLQAVINPGDEVIIPAPYWVSYPDMVLLANGDPKIIKADLEQDFKINPQQLANAITPKTKMLILNSPSNPTGKAYTKQELAALGEVLAEHPNILIATDDMYEHILWTNDPFSNIAMACPSLKDRTIVLSGVSKAYSMTGWRIGYSAGPKDIIKAMKKIQSQSTSNPCSIAQAAARCALESGLDCVKPMVKEFKIRHDYLVEELNKLPGVKCTPADGTFYAFPCVRELINNSDKFSNDSQFAEFLIQEAMVAVVPGSAFGAEGYIRLSYATSMENLQNAVARLRKVLIL